MRRGKNYLDNHQDFIPLQIIHLFGHAIGKELLFYCDADYYMFLRELKKRMSPYVHIVTYNLLSNHYHIVVFTKSEAELKKQLENEISHNKKHFYYKGYHKEMMQRWANFFNSYSKRINISYNRKGNLFRKSFCRKIVFDDQSKIDLCLYVMLNHVKHYKIIDPYDYQFTGLHDHLDHKGAQQICSKKIFDFVNSKKHLRKLIQSKMQEFLDRAA